MNGRNLEALSPEALSLQALSPEALSPEALSLEAAEPRWRAPVARGLPVLIFGAFFAYFILLCFRHDGWGGDFQLYCAAVSRLYHGFLHPSHEAMPVPFYQSTAYTLYLVVVAALGKLLGATPYRALEWAGVVNLLLLGGSVAYLFSRASIHRRWWLPAACFMYTMLFLRWHHFGWSSEINLTNLQYVQPYPSTAAWYLSFFSFGLMKDLSRKRRLVETAALGLLLGALLMTHVLTASWAIGIVGLHALWTGGAQSSWRALLLPLLAIGIAVGLAAVWPYSPLFGQQSMWHVQEPHDFGDPLVDMPNLYAVSVPCYAYLLLRLRRHAFWLLGLAATGGALYVWRVTGFSFGYRYSFFMGFFPQFVIAEVMALGIYALLGPLVELSARRRWAGLDRPLLLAILIGSLVAWLPSPMLRKARQEVHYGTLRSPLTIWRRPSPMQEYYARFDELRPYLSEADLVLFPVSRDAFDLASITGAQVVSSPNALLVPDRWGRERDVAQFFDPAASPGERDDVLAEHHPTKLVLPAQRFDLLSPLTEQYGPPVFSNERYALWDLSA
jgi:hypothetical protein